MTDFQIDYAIVDEAAAAMQKAAQEYRDMAKNLGQTGDDLRSRSMIGKGGRAADNFAENLNKRLLQQARRLGELRRALLVTSGRVSETDEETMKSLFTD
jgi:uncharacterized protein YukE